MTLYNRITAILLAGCLIHSGPVAAYLCVDHQSRMASCCPGEGHEATDHGMMVIASDSGLVSDCDPVTTDEQSSTSSSSPERVAVGIDLLSTPVSTKLSADQDSIVSYPRYHGPPVYLSTLRVRL